MVDFPTGTNEDVFSSSSVYSAFSRLSAYLVISGHRRFNKFTPLSYVNTDVNWYMFILYCYFS